MGFPWFRRIAFLFMPVKWPGWVILIAALACAVWVFIDIDSRSHSVSDTLLNFVFNLFLIAVAYTIVALVTSFGRAR